MNFFDAIVCFNLIMGIVIIGIIICQYNTHQKIKKYSTLQQKTVLWCNTIYENQETLLKDIIKLKQETKMRK